MNVFRHKPGVRAQRFTRIRQLEVLKFPEVVMERLRIGSTAEMARKEEKKRRHQKEDAVLFLFFVQSSGGLGSILIQFDKIAELIRIFQYFFQSRRAIILGLHEA